MLDKRATNARLKCISSALKIWHLMYVFLSPNQKLIWESWLECLAFRVKLNFLCFMHRATLKRDTHRDTRIIRIESIGLKFN